MKTGDQLESQSLILMVATMVGHLGNYVYHVITGRMLSSAEYGLLMALFGMINFLLIPMSALGLALTRAVSVDLQDHHGAGLKQMGRQWTMGMCFTALILLTAAFIFSDRLQVLLGFSRSAPILLAACIPGINLLLTLSGSLLQGLQQFKSLALRGSVLFVLRALLVGFCLWFGWRAAGWALFAHLMGMAGALAISIWMIFKHAPKADKQSAPGALPILSKAFAAMPVLFAFSILMTADVIFVRHYFNPDVSGQFAQAATLGRMVLWLPLPIAQVMFPKVVRNTAANSMQIKTLYKALSYTVLLVAGALVSGWVMAPFALQSMYGIEHPSPDQVAWFRSTAVAMSLLGPVYLLIQYQLARGKICKLLPLCLLAVLYPVLIKFRHQSPLQISIVLIFLCGAALITSLIILREEV